MKKEKLGVEVPNPWQLACGVGREAGAKLHTHAPHHASRHHSGHQPRGKKPKKTIKNPKKGVAHHRATKLPRIPADVHVGISQINTIGMNSSGSESKRESVWARAIRGSQFREDGVPPLDSSERALAALLAQASNSSAATFVNLLKSKGFKIVAPPELQDKEMDEISARSTPKESKVEEPAKWVQDEDIWDRAKTAADKSYDPSSDLYWPVVTYIYKKMGGSIKGQKQAASASGFPQVTRGKSKESSIKDSFCGQMRFLESYSDESNPTRFRCVLIQEGLGNFGDAYYYTRQALESAVPVFEGKKIYADHPDKAEEENRPERSVKDVLGHFENVKLEEGADGRAMLTADVVVLPDEPYQWARALMRHSVEYAKKYPDKDFIGLSINARGDSTVVPMAEWVKEAHIPASSMEKLRQATERGIDQIRLVTSIREAISCDMVTEAGAGGRIINFIERA